MKIYIYLLRLIVMEEEAAIKTMETQVEALNIDIISRGLPEGVTL